jgi:hypothetical protein
MSENGFKIISMADGRVFVYDGVPGAGGLVASHAALGQPGGADLFGNNYPAGDWCREDFELVRQVEVWPGTLIHKR